MIYRCEITSTNVPYSRIRHRPTNCPHSFLAKITSIESGGRNLPKEFETVIVFNPRACEAYDKEKNTYSSFLTTPLEMICVGDYIEFAGIPYKNGKPSAPMYPENADWIAIDTSSHIKRLPFDLKSARKLVKYLEKEKKEKILAQCKTILNWPYESIKNGLRWINSQLPLIVASAIAGIISGIISGIIVHHFTK